MPYINQDARAKLVYWFKGGPETPGELNYLITGLVQRYLFESGHQLTYTRLNDAIGVLEAAKLELYRRIAAPYEDHKIDDNGDVYPTDLWRYFG